MGDLQDAGAPAVAVPGRHTAVVGEGDATDNRTVESWQRRFAELIIPCVVRPTRSGRFSANADLVDVKGVLVARYLLSPLRMERGDDHRDGRDDSVTFSIATAGKLRCTQGGRVAEFGAGEAVLLSTRCANSLETTGGGFIGIKLPRALVAASAPSIVDAEFCHVGAASAPLRHLLVYVDAMIGSQADLSPELAPLFARHIAEFIGAAVMNGPQAAGDETRAARRSARRLALQTSIEHHAADPELTLERFATFVGLSPRSIQGVFSEEGTSFSDRLREVRLERARQAILRGGAGASIAAIAFDVGFRDISTFNRAFRRHFGKTPGDMRAAGGWNH